MSVSERRALLLWRRIKESWRISRAEGPEAPTARKSLLAICEVIATELETRPGVRLELTPRTLVIDGTEVDDSQRDQSIVRALHADGVRAIEIVRGATEEEVTDLFDLWWAFLLGRIGGEHTFSTLAFEGEGRSVRVLSEASGFDDEDQGERQRRARLSEEWVAKLCSPKLSERIELGDPSGLLHARGLTEGEVLDPTLSARELADLAAGARSLRSTGLSELILLMKALDRAEESSKDSVSELAFHVIAQLVTSASDLDRTLDRMSDRFEHDEALEDELFRAAFEPQRIAVFSSLLTDRVQAPGARAVLRYLRNEDLDLLLDRLPEAKAGERIELAKLIAAKSVPPAELAAHVIGASEEVALSLFELAAAISEEHLDLLVRASLVSEHATVRTRALAASKPRQIPELAELLESCFVDPSGVVQRAAVNAIARAKNDHAVTLLCAPLAARGDSDLKRACIRAIAGIGGPVSTSALCRVAGDLRDRGVRMAAIASLGELDDDASAVFLRMLTKRADEDRSIREAAKHALAGRGKS
ncbi:MAG: HEAT repeat domain-containing protein [Deltaproteobacteria bacterium]|nr:HEAT repeat domain-containing protein [Deltaproteobacteria bacterium]